MFLARVAENIGEWYFARILSQRSLVNARNTGWVGGQRQLLSVSPLREVMPAASFAKKFRKIGICYSLQRHASASSKLLFSATCDASELWDRQFGAKLMFSLKHALHLIALACHLNHELCSMLVSVLDIGNLSIYTGGLGYTRDGLSVRPSSRPLAGVMTPGSDVPDGKNAGTCR